MPQLRYELATFGVPASAIRLQHGLLRIIVPGVSRGFVPDYASFAKAWEQGIIGAKAAFFQLSGRLQS